MLENNLPKSNRLQIVLKTVERCNIACTYCYFFNGEHATYSTKPPYIKTDVIENLIIFLKSASNSKLVDSIQVVLHGGEPLMQKKHLFDQMCTSLRANLDPVTDFSLVMQTNGMLIDDEWIEILAKHKVGLGVSLDGPQEYHDIDRLDKKGRGTYQKVIKGISKLQEACLSGLMPRVSLLAVVNPNFNGGKVYRHFVDDLHVKHMNFLLPDLNYETIGDHKYRMVDYANYLISVFNEWVKDDNDNIHIRLVSEGILPILFYEDYVDYNKNNNTYVVVVNSDGELSIEDTLVTTGGFNEVNIGMNVANTHFEHFFYSKQFQYYYNNLVLGIPDLCQKCCWVNICNGGKATYRYSKNNLYNNPSIYCDALKLYFERLLQYLVSTGVSREHIQRALVG